MAAVTGCQLTLAARLSDRLIATRFSVGHLPMWKTGFLVPAPSLRGPDVPPFRGQSYATLRTFVGFYPIAREMLRNPILAALPRTLNNPYFRTLLEHVIALAA